MRKLLAVFVVGLLFGAAAMYFWTGRGWRVPTLEEAAVAASVDPPAPFGEPPLPAGAIPDSDPDRHDEVVVAFDAPPADTAPASATGTGAAAVDGATPPLEVSVSPAASASPMPAASPVASTPAEDPIVPAAPAAEPPNPEPALAQTPVPVPSPADAQPSAVAAPSFEPQPGALLIPVEGISAKQLVDTFSESRGGVRLHEAIDIIAPKGTPVLAVENGRVAKLFTSERGGLTLYQFDAGEKLAFYYAHLDGYAPGLVEGAVLKRGDLVGYVGVTGNANPAAPHLHFAVFMLGPEKRWWKGTALNPYPLLSGAQSATPLAGQ